MRGCAWPIAPSANPTGGFNLSTTRKSKSNEASRLRDIVACMNRYTRTAIAVLIGVFMVEAGNRIGGTWGGLAIAAGGIILLYALVVLFRRRWR
jgi:hypothetical protein